MRAPHAGVLPPTLALFVAALLLLPEEASLFLGPLRLPVERAMLLGLTPYALYQYIGQRSGAAKRFVWSDLLIPVTGSWMVAAVWVTEGPERALVGASATALELVGGYFVARTLLTQPGQALALSRLLAFLLAIVGAASLADPLTGSYFIHNAVAALTHYPTDYAPDVRHGLVRATSTLEHPILLGSACGFGALLAAVTLKGSRRALALIGNLTGVIAAISSAPISGLLIGFGCLAYGRLTPGFEARWRLLLAAAGVLLMAIFLALPAPFGWLIGHTTFEPSSGYFRLLIWQIAGADVMQSPLFGLGLSDTWARPDWMPPSVDSVWLRSAMSFGIPGSVLLALCMLTACGRRLDTQRVALSEQERRLGLTLSLILFLYAYQGFTVHFWGITWTLLGLFMGMRAHLGALAARSRTARDVSLARARLPAQPALAMVAES